MGNLNPYTWVAPAATTGTMGMVFNSLTQWLLNPEFPNGVNLGNAPDPAANLPAAATTTQVALQTATFVSTAVVTQIVPHNISLGAVLFCQAFGQGPSGAEHQLLEVTDVDTFNVYVNTTGITAGNGCHFALLFTTDPTVRGW